MAVQKSRKSPSKRGMRRAHDALSAKQLATDPTSGETHLRHHVTADGYYRGKQVIAPKTPVVDEEGLQAARPVATAPPRPRQKRGRWRFCRPPVDGWQDARLTRRIARIG